MKEQEKFLDQTKEDLAVIKSMSTNFATQREKDRHKNAIVKAKKKIETVKRKVVAAEKRVETAKNQVERGKNSVGTAKERVYKAKLAFKKIESQEKISKKTKTWNLGTSLKSYIDPSRESFHGLKETQMSKTMFLVVKKHLKYKNIHGN